MLVFIRQQNIYRRSYETASPPVVLEGIVALLDGYDASSLLRLWNTVKFSWSDKVKQMKAMIFCKYVEIYMSTEYIQPEI